MAPYKPYKFIIFDKYLKNSNFHEQIISYLKLSLLCKEIYINETFSKLNYESICRDKLLYYSDHNLIDKLKENKLRDVNVKKNFSNKNNIYLNDVVNNNLRRIEDKKKNQELEMKDGNQKNKIEKEVLNGDFNKITKKNGIVSFFIYDGNKEEFLSMLNLNENYNVDHMNILCLNNFKSISNIFKNFKFNNRISIYCPFYIIHNNDKYRNVNRKIKDFFYSIFSDFLPLHYKNINLSDLIRAIILNSELCQYKSNNSMEILKFLDIMEIIGKI